MSRADELVELIRGRIHSEFDGECHLTDTEAHAIADFLSEAERKAARSEAEKLGLLQELKRHTGYDHGFMAIRVLVDRASEAERRARREALEEAAKTIEEGFDRGIASKHDMCVHKKFEWEDCEPCAANAIRALIPSEPHDAEGRETPRRGDPSIFDDAEGRN